MTLVIAIAFLVTVTHALQGSALEEARLQRENMVRKYLKKLKKEDGAIKLVGGRGDFEGECVFIRYRLHSHNKYLVLSKLIRKMFSMVW